MAEMDVVELPSAKSLLPNMTIQLGEDDDNDNLVDVTYDDPKKEDNEEEQSKNSSQKVEVDLSSTNNSHLYENKRYKELKELGLTVEELKERKNLRAKRFDMSEDCEMPDANELLSLDEDTLNPSKLLEKIEKHNSKHEVYATEYIRTDAIYLHGVESMSTDEVFKLFNNFDSKFEPPRLMEWINDSSCNVVWKNTDSERIASILLAITGEKSCEEKEDKEEVSLVKKKLEEDHEDLDDLDLMDTSEPLDEIEEKVEKVTEKVEVKNAGDEEEEINPLLRCKEAMSGPRFLSARFSLVGDRKERGAARKSAYYRKHGNPHYGGMKGVLTSSYKRRFQQQQTDEELREIGIDTSRQMTERRKRKHATLIYRRPKTQDQVDDEELITASANNLSGAIYIGDPNNDESSDEEEDYQTMRADEEEAISKKRPRHQQKLLRKHRSTPSSSLKSRLGAKVNSAARSSSSERSDVESQDKKSPTIPVGDLRAFLRKKRSK